MPAFLPKGVRIAPDVGSLEGKRLACLAMIGNRRECRRMALEIKTRTVDDAGVVEVSGELDHHSFDKLKAAARRLLARANAKAAVIDVSGLVFIDSSGLSALIWIVREMERRNGRVILIPNPFVSELLHMTNVQVLFEIASSQEEALASLRLKQAQG